MTENFAQELRKEGLLVDETQSVKAILIPLAVAGIAIVVGGMKIFIGISRERPVEYLELLSFVTMIVALVAFARKPMRSRYGDRVLEQLRDQYGHLRHVGHHNFAVDPDSLVLAVGLFGMGALAGSELGYLTTALRTPPASSSGCNSSTSGCGGGSSCGGGGGDGGGGGCGGGGGGCGGCGGG
jgi:uncharacterized membrane protein YgcG